VLSRRLLRDQLRTDHQRSIQHQDPHACN
jgi:hypothetical protein